MNALKWAFGGLLAAAALGTGLAASRDDTTLMLSQGARVGVVNMLDGELTHLHTSKDLKQSFLKTHAVSWPIDAMLMDAVKQRLTELGLIGVALGPGDALARSRDDFFVNNSVAKGLPRACASQLAQLAAAQHLDALILLAPGLNNSAQGGKAVRRELPEYLRGWGFVTDAQAGRKPELFDMAQLLLVGVSSGTATLSAREWGGAYTDEWVGYVPPPDLRQMPPELLGQLQPLFARILSRQAERLLMRVAVNR